MTHQMKPTFFPPYILMFMYGQPPSNSLMDSSSTNEEYDIFNYSPSTQMSYHMSYQMQGEFQINTWENPKFPIHGKVVDRTQEIYAWHVHTYNRCYFHPCLQIFSSKRYIYQQNNLPNNQTDRQSTYVLESASKMFWASTVTPTPILSASASACLQFTHQIMTTSENEKQKQK